MDKAKCVLEVDGAEWGMLVHHCQALLHTSIHSQLPGVEVQYGEDYEGLGKEVVLVTPMLALSPAGEDYMTGSSKAPQAS